MRLQLTLPPSKNALHVRTRFGIATSHKAKQWTRLAVTEILLQADTKELLRFTEWVRNNKLLVVSVKVFFPDARKRDAHNCLEVLADAIQEATGIDDSFYLMRVMLKEIDKDSPRVEVVITKDE